MPSWLYQIAATTIAAVRPSLFRFKADAGARRGVRVTQSCDTIDIVKDDRAIRLNRSNWAYVPDMINSFDYFHGSAGPITVRCRGGLTRLVDFSSPRLHEVAGFDDFPVLCPSQTEPFLTTEQYLDFAALKPGDVALDLGSYSGLTSIAFSKAVGATGTVIALEPDPLNYACVKKNVEVHGKRNGLDNIVVVQAAAAPISGKLLLSSEGAMGSALSSIVGGNRGEVIEVESVSLLDLVARYKLAKVDFIKIDIEGAELALITESTAFLERYRPRLVIEPHSIGGQLTSGPIIACLERLGYACDVIEQHGLSLPLINAAFPPSSRS
jgi:FkbM family methyltransferase